MESAILEAPAVQELSEAELRQSYGEMNETDRAKIYIRDINRFVDLDLEEQTSDVITAKDSLDRSLAVLGEFVFAAVTTPDLKQKFKEASSNATNMSLEAELQTGEKSLRMRRQASLERARTMVLTNVILSRPDLAEQPQGENTEETMVPEETEEGGRIIAEFSYKRDPYQGKESVDGFLVDRVVNEG